jgi:hypothetical protein
LAPIALAAPPAAPVVTVGADHVKRLQFDWPSVPGVGRYELWFRAAPDAEWVKYAEPIPPQRSNIRINVSVHLLDWRVARYRVAACNPSGCTYSAEVGVEDLALDAVGYLKPNYAGEGRWFGQAVAMSADGMTAAVAIAESNGINADNGIVYVYRKTNTTSAWQLEARLKPSLFRRSSSAYPGTSLAVNGNGTLIAYGRATEGIGGQSYNGAVYLFRRNGTSWSQEKRLAGGRENDRFGNAVDLDDSGNTLAVWRGGNGPDGYGAVEIYNRSSAGWQPTATVPAPPDELPPNEAGYSTCGPYQALSGDGQTLVRTCNVPGLPPVVLVYNAPGWAESARIVTGTGVDIDTNFDGTLFVTRRSSVVDVYRLEQNVWNPDIGGPIDINSGPIFVPPGRTSIALSRDGRFVAAGSTELGQGTIGPNYPPIPDDASGARGSVHVFERKPSGWQLRRLMKPSVATSTSFGIAVAISATGHNLIVGSVFDSSAATGINGDPTDTSAPGTGAAWLY